MLSLLPSGATQNFAVPGLDPGTPVSIPNAASKTWMAGSTPAKAKLVSALAETDIPARVLVPRAPALVAGFREVVWLSPDGEIEALSTDEAKARLAHETVLVCHARATARRLDMPGFAALDLLELFAFVRPARFCVPTARGLATALGLAAPESLAEACVTLATAARALLQELAQETDPNAAHQLVHDELLLDGNSRQNLIDKDE